MDSIKQADVFFSWLRVVIKNTQQIVYLKRQIIITIIIIYYNDSSILIISSILLRISPFTFSSGSSYGLLGLNFSSAPSIPAHLADVKLTAYLVFAMPALVTLSAPAAI